VLPAQAVGRLANLCFLLPSAITIALRKTNECPVRAPGWEFVSILFFAVAQTRVRFVLSSERESMERPGHALAAVSSSKSSRTAGVVVVVVIHVIIITALIIGLRQAQLHKEMLALNVSVEQQKALPKAPPPPPPDLIRPPPTTTIVPEFAITAPPPPKAVAPPAPSAPPARVAPTKLEPIARTHTIPPYPTISQRLGEQGTSVLQVAISAAGSVTECKVAKSSGSERLDAAACTYVQEHWKWQPPTQEGKPVAANTDVNVVWNLKDTQ
jgi:protein TonB